MPMSNPSTVETPPTEESTVKITVELGAATAAALDSLAKDDHRSRKAQAEYLLTRAIVSAK